MLPRTPAEALEFFSRLSPSSIKLGLERVEAALEALGHPERRFPALHVAGTNGKGSTCAFASAALHAAGHRVGLYTSPHLVRVNERIRVDGVEISDETFGQRILEVLERHPEAATSLTYFEFGTVVAFWHFAREAVDVAVVEVGLGGRLDATRACVPLVTAITPVSFDHMEYLGNTLGAIAAEKAGILKPGVPVVLSRQAPEALEVLERLARERQAPVLLEGRDFHLGQRPGGGLAYEGSGLSLEGLSLSLRGEHQWQNAAVALAALEQLSARGVRVPPEALRTGLAGARWPGRLEELGGSPPVLLDGAHNPAGVGVLLEGLRSLYPGRRVHCVFGVVADKDRGPMLRALLPACSSVHLTPLDTPRSLSPESYLDKARALCENAYSYASLDAALAGALAQAAPSDVLLCTGSLFLVGSVRAKWGGNLGALHQHS
ncbi:bifunctional folylpolyglutamate synthase/dihydrofolate synthase [Cystobacter fuscus]|uniref:Dihydrofolate synthase/folylpolyglutamate synthase n=1 Tax=Cystobacter fuscus TaxID=43 RepID=A0A250J1E6_9BACT|nr:folylpolyglutamate synthase/dihydrofolate synthase family protein [Cystobacter fuscus]ATB37809.1 bifunctional folylpolyglutamate synthase/dihydrofolate synthase [Cystobacter fuscus]